MPELRFSPATSSIGMSSQPAAAFGMTRYMHDVAGMYLSASPARRRPEVLAAEA